MAFIASGGGAGMEWKTAPDATNYIDMLEKVRALCDDNNSSATTHSGIGTAGTSGYAVGDFLQLADGGATEAFPSALSGCRTTFEVTAVSSGQVTAVRIRQHGCYSTLPTNNGTADEFDTTVLSGSGVGTVSITGVLFSGNGWTIERITQEVDTAAVGAAGGTGYNVGDDIEPVGGDTRTGFDAPQSTNRASFNVDSVSGGAITAISILGRGIYHRNPGTNEVATNALTGSGNDDATVDLTFRDFTDTTTDRELIMTSTDGFHVGIRSYNNGVGVFNWEIMGMQEYVAANDWDAQLTQSPGRYPDDDEGCYVVLENETFSYWLSVTDRRIVLVCNLAVGIYTNMWLGAFDNYGTASQYPTPLAAIGSASRHTFSQGSKTSQFAGMNLCIATVSGDADGPGEVLTPGAGWVTLRNGNGSNSTNDIDLSPSYSFASAIPGGDFNPVGTAFDDENEFVGDTLNGSLRERWAYWCFTVDPDDGSGIGANANDRRFVPMRNQGDPELPVLWEITLVDTTGSDPRLLGELGGVRQVDQRVAAGFMNSEDEIDDGTDYWYVFNNCRLNLHWTYFAMQGV